MKKRKKGRRSEEVVSSGVEEKGVGARARMIGSGGSWTEYSYGVVGMHRNRITAYLLRWVFLPLAAIIRIFVYTTTEQATEYNRRRHFI